MFCVVETEGHPKNLVVAVSNKWVQLTEDGNVLLWPPKMSGKKLQEYRRLEIAPEKSWTQYPINRIIFKNLRKYIPLKINITIN